MTFAVQDEHGNILYRHDRVGGGRYGDDGYIRYALHYKFDGNLVRSIAVPAIRSKVIMIDEYGNQIPL